MPFYCTDEDAHGAGKDVEDGLTRNKECENRDYVILVGLFWFFLHTENNDASDRLLRIQLTVRGVNLLSDIANPCT